MGKNSKFVIFVTIIIVTAITFMAYSFIVFAASATATVAVTATAAPTDSTVLINGDDISFDAYNINDNNYFKLRDIAYTLSGSEKQFEVGWDDANNAISLTSGQPYTVVGGEMTGNEVNAVSVDSANGISSAIEAAPTDSQIYLDGREVKFTAYNIDGYNYFKLRDIGKAFDFGVDWDEERDTILVDTTKAYTVDSGAVKTYLTPLEAGSILQTWVESHPFQLGSELDPASNGYTIDDTGYYRFYLNVIKLGVAEILVNDETGELFHLSSPYNSGKFEPIDDWYNREHAAGAPDISAYKARILYEDWVNAHTYLRTYALSWLPNKIYEVDGDYYYWFVADDDESYWYNILVKINTGELFFMMISDGEDVLVEIEPLDDYFRGFGLSGF